MVYYIAASIVWILERVVMHTCLCVIYIHCARSVVQSSPAGIFVQTTISRRSINLCRPAERIHGAWGKL